MLLIITVVNCLLRFLLLIDITEPKINKFENTGECDQVQTYHKLVHSLPYFQHIILFFKDMVKTCMSIPGVSHTS